MKKLLSLALLGLAGAVLACDSQTGITDLEFNPSYGMQKVEVCHLDGTGRYQLITIADPALAAHLEHGDAEPGDPYPGMVGTVFGGLCEPVELSGIFGAVTWTSAPGAQGLYTEFAVNATTVAGTVWFRSSTGTFTMSVECAIVIGTEGWAGGTITYADGVYADRVSNPTLFYAKDNGTVATPDGIGTYYSRSCSNGFPGTNTTIFYGGGTVTDGDLIVR